jgi:hypothetical protein
VQLPCLCIIDRDDKSPSPFEWYAHDDEASFFNSLHRAVTGPWFHGGHAASPFVVSYFYYRASGPGEKT